MTNINSLAKSKRFNFYPEDISIRSSINRQVFPVCRPDIQTHMVMIGPEFSEIGSQADGNIQWISEVILGIDVGLKKLTGSDSGVKNQDRKRTVSDT